MYRHIQFVLNTRKLKAGISERLTKTVNLQ